jgi:hypothetical protein
VVGAGRTHMPAMGRVERRVLDVGIAMGAGMTAEASKQEQQTATG